MEISYTRSREIRLWWPLPLAVLIWLVVIWAFGFFLSESEVEVAVSVPDAIEAEFLELPEQAQPQESIPPPRKGTEKQPETTSEVESVPEFKTPPQPRARPQPPPVRPDRNTVPEVPSSKEKTVTETEAESQPDTDAPSDLSEYINQRRTQTHRSVQSGPRGIFDGVENARKPDAQPQPSEEEIRMAKVKRNLETPGTSGVFQILEISPRYARFSFRAWTKGASNPRREVIEVEAGAGGDIERAIIRRMIQLIREYHQEDFNWESRRLNRVIVLSARPSDNEGLEDFLMREFFGEPLPPYMR